MSKTTNSSINNFDNYIQMQKLNCVLKMRFNNDNLTDPAEKSRHSMASKQNEVLEFTIRPGYSLSVFIEKVR